MAENGKNIIFFLILMLVYTIFGFEPTILALLFLILTKIGKNS
tara:strand:- start:565 stop:693 length:129 start_codon:yes stop_codon:yes gene_type:complete